MSPLPTPQERKTSFLPCLERQGFPEVALYEQLDTLLRGHIAVTLGSLGEESIIPDLLALLSNEQFTEIVRGHIAVTLGSLGEKSIIPGLLALLSNEQLSEDARRSIAGALGELPQDELMVQHLARLLVTSDIPDVVYPLLWTTSRRIGVRIIPTPGTEGVQFAVVKW